MGAGGCAHGRRCRAKTETGNDENLCFVAALIGYGLCKCQRLRAFYGSHMQKQEAFPQYLPKTEWLHRAIGGELDLTKLDGELVCTMHEYPCLCKFTTSICLVCTFSFFFAEFSLLVLFDAGKVKKQDWSRH